MARARARKPESLDNLTRKEWIKIINQAALGKEDKFIAKLYLLDAVPQIDIAVKLNMERSTISRRLPRILDKIERTAHKIGIV